MDNLTNAIPKLRISDPLKFSRVWDPLDLGFAELKGFGKFKFDPLIFCARANPALRTMFYSIPSSGQVNSIYM